MHRRTKALQIPSKVKNTVYDRDGGRCVLCGRFAKPEWACAHYIARSHGGLGVEQNILTLCPPCHVRYDQSIERKAIRSILREYLERCYDDWSEDKLIYRKGE
jgi:5-methylcytosine-specific restriction endonuclease McrA